jgi:hypothetical protein
MLFAMQMTSREVVIRTVRFQGADRIPLDLPPEYGTDFDLVTILGRPKGGFIARWYGDPVSVGHRREAIDAMSEEFMRLGCRPSLAT